MITADWLSKNLIENLKVKLNEVWNENLNQPGKQKRMVQMISILILNPLLFQWFIYGLRR